MYLRVWAGAQVPIEKRLWALKKISQLIGIGQISIVNQVHS